MRGFSRACVVIDYSAVLPMHREEVTVVKAEESVRKEA